MPSIQNLQHDYEPSRALKAAFLATRKAADILGGAIHPGLFQTADAASDARRCVAAFALESYGLFNLMHVGSIVLPAALALVAVDVAGALLFHFKVGDRHRLKCEIAVTDSPADQERLRLRDTGLRKAIRGFGGLMILGSAAWKSVSFASLAQTTDTPLAVIALVILSYVTAGLLHLTSTGWALAEWWLAICMERERRSTLRQDAKTAPCVIRRHRNHYFTSPVRLQPTSVEGHDLIETDAAGKRYTLRTWGLLLDSHVGTFAALQDESPQKATVAREALRAQLAMLGGDPLHGVAETPVALHEVSNSDPAAAGSGGATAAGHAIRAVSLLAASALFFTGCGNEPRPSKDIVVNVFVPVTALENKETLPQVLVDLIAPESIPAKPGANETVLVPKVVIEIIGGAETSPTVIEPHVKADAGFWAGLTRAASKTYGVAAPAARKLASTREQMLALHIANTLAPVAAGPAEDSTTNTLESRLSKASSPGMIAVESSGNPSGGKIPIGMADVPVFVDAASARDALTSAAKNGETNFTVLYDLKKLMEDQAQEVVSATAAKNLADAMGDPPGLWTSTPIEQSIAIEPMQLLHYKPTVCYVEPVVLPLNGTLSHSALVDGAEARLTIAFATGSAKLEEHHVREIERFTDRYKHAPGQTSGQWIVIGYADGTGSVDENDALSLERAKRVAAELRSVGIAASGVYGAGATRRIAPNDTAQGRSQNRRVTVYWKPSVQVE